MNYKYITTKRIGGRIKERSEDFLVEEIGKDYVTQINYLPDKKVFVDWKEVFFKKENNNYLHVDLEKRGLSTTQAINDLSRFLRISQKKIGFAGLKDKRAITSQRISIYDPPKERISKFYYKNIKIYNPSFEEKEITIGDLKENKFIVTVRQIEKQENLKKIIEEIITTVKKQGIINYYGEQRFGGIREITHRIGKLFLQRKYKEAVVLYLTETNDYEEEHIKKAREDLKDLDYKKHAANFPIKAGFEKQLLNHLVNQPEDYLGAVKSLPKSIQYLFIHAYQSYLFNELINLRLEKGYGLEKIEGDKIIDNNIYLPIFGFETTFSQGKAGELERELLRKEEISLLDFKNQDCGTLSSKGEYRQLFSKVKNINIEEIEKDELHEDKLKLKISFVLEKGQYATNFLREIIKPEKKTWC
jgi:tRNA pseudouridine13 synthase